MICLHNSSKNKFISLLEILYEKGIPQLLVLQENVHFTKKNIEFNYQGLSLIEQNQLFVSPI
jgi:hypothetical protein